MGFTPDLGVAEYYDTVKLAKLLVEGLGNALSSVMSYKSCELLDRNLVDSSMTSETLKSLSEELGSAIPQQLQKCYEPIVSSSGLEVMLEIVETVYDNLVKRDYGGDMPSLARLIIDTDSGLEMFLEALDWESAPDKDTSPSLQCLKAFIRFWLRIMEDNLTNRKALNVVLGPSRYVFSRGNLPLSHDDIPKLIIKEELLHCYEKAFGFVQKKSLAHLKGLFEDDLMSPTSISKRERTAAPDVVP